MNQFCNVFPAKNPFLSIENGYERKAALLALAQQIGRFIESEEGLSGVLTPTFFDTGYGFSYTVNPELTAEKTGFKGVREVNVAVASNGDAFKSLVFSDDEWLTEMLYPAIAVDFGAGIWKQCQSDRPFFQELAARFGTNDVVFGYQI
ncbi:MAG TPA: hypothetical protein VGK74_11780 [Symbiobacteriaceae bacterium]